MLHTPIIKLKTNTKYYIQLLNTKMHYTVYCIEVKWEGNTDSLNTG